MTDSSKHHQPEPCGNPLFDDSTTNKNSSGHLGSVSSKRKRKRKRKKSSVQIIDSKSSSGSSNSSDRPNTNQSSELQHVHSPCATESSVHALEVVYEGPLTRSRTKMQRIHSSKGNSLGSSGGPWAVEYKGLMTRSRSRALRNNHPEGPESPNNPPAKTHGSNYEKHAAPSSFVCSECEETVVFDPTDLDDVQNPRNPNNPNTLVNKDTRAGQWYCQWCWEVYWTEDNPGQVQKSYSDTNSGD